MGLAKAFFFLCEGFCVRIKRKRKGTHKKGKTITCFSFFLLFLSLKRVGGKKAGGQKEKMGLAKAFFFLYVGWIAGG